MGAKITFYKKNEDSTLSTIRFIDKAIESWERWAYKRPRELPKDRITAFYSHDCNYYPRKVPRCPACEAGIPRRVVTRTKE